MNYNKFEFFAFFPTYLFSIFFDSLYITFHNQRTHTRIFKNFKKISEEMERLSCNNDLKATKIKIQSEEFFVPEIAETTLFFKKNDKLYRYKNILLFPERKKA